MSYIVLARRLRPKTLDDVIGQPLVVQALTNALNNQTVHPVYLLTGTRGVGKTTIARIIAKSLNCENGPHPCLKCDSCTMIQQGSYPDMYEIDAASRTKVEDTREILDQVQYMPQIGRKKVYLIDEVHMLSQHSFNALLKTLEEPPAHVQFILATTEPEKIPKTILSRCLHFNLKSITASDIQAYLATVLTKDNIRFDDDALQQVAEAGDGSMRDALSILDQCLAISPTHLSNETTQSLLNTIAHTQLQEVIQAIANQDIAALEERCHAFEKNNIDFRDLLKQMANLLIQTSIHQLQGKTSPYTGLWSNEYLQVLYRMIMQGIQDLEYSPSVKLGALMCMVRMAVFKPSQESSTPQPKVTATPRPVKKNQEPATNLAPKPTSHNWTDIIAQMTLTPMLKNLAENATLESKTDQQWTLILNQSHKHLLSDTITKKLEHAINQTFNKTINLVIKLTEAPQQTPAAEKKAVKDTNDAQAKEKMQKDPILSSLLSELNVADDAVSITSHE
ncbi:DNA polymerase III subunit gamma/tau [Candidatus Synchoanobacter obligatus]|uniref:DNA polymerase III subunit gamma/tau n=1 Tax=Candidatus Synchoanobacter obligatus TaxID=2919597 RepID=A0ABT1L673_9GAMM|nr:DNA polymerase III subunit gamma/tau [Candidatus Synchoanobacter obligatus]MCP8351958.1 DNA polymerase III subunit gamma/tau [Candidatus Synchoanobacter obligatus]